jgi:hypothetical protein
MQRNRTDKKYRDGKEISLQNFGNDDCSQTEYDIAGRFRGRGGETNEKIDRRDLALFVV